MARTTVPELGELVKKALKNRRWTLRQAQIRTGVHYSTIHNMRAGVRPSAHTLMKWAEGLGEEPASWLKSAGYEFIDTLPSGNGSGPSLAHQYTRREDVLPDLVRERFVDDEEQEVIEFMHGAPTGDKEKLLSYLRFLKAQEA